MRPQFEFRRAIIGARISTGLMQKELAQRMETTETGTGRMPVFRCKVYDVS